MRPVVAFVAVAVASTLGACNPRQEAGSRPRYQLEASPSPVAWDQGPSIPKPVTVKNTGSLPVPIVSVSLGGHHPSAFLTNGGNCVGSTLQPGATCTVVVEFKSSEGAGRRATLDIAGPGGTILSVPLSGPAGIR